MSVHGGANGPPPADLRQPAHVHLALHEALHHAHLELLLHSSSLARSKRNDTTCTSNLPGIEPLCRTRKIMLLHFSKCSGTWLCQLAQQAGCSTWHNHSAAQLWKPQNCALRTTAFQDGPWWIPKEHAPHAWHRANFAYHAHAAAGRGRVSW